MITENLKSSELEEAITKTLKQLHGSFALGIVFKDKPDLIIGARRGSPLAVGYGPNENYLGSDSYALKSMTNKITYLEDGELATITSKKESELNLSLKSGSIYATRLRIRRSMNKDRSYKNDLVHIFHKTSSLYSFLKHIYFCS